MIGEIAGHPADPTFAPMRPGELQRSAIAVDRARRDLGWSARMPLDEGMRATYRWVESGAPDRAPY